MFGLGIWEIFSILLIAIVFINPKDLPKIARTLGRWYGKIRNINNMLKTNMEGIIEEEIKKPLRDMEKEIEEPVQEVEEAIKAPLDSDTWNDYVPDLSTIMPSRDYSLPPKKEEPGKEENNDTKI